MLDAEEVDSEDSAELLTKLLDVFELIDELEATLKLLELSVIELTLLLELVTMLLELLALLDDAGVDEPPEEPPPPQATSNALNTTDVRTDIFDMGYISVNHYCYWQIPGPSRSIHDAPW